MVKTLLHSALSFVLLLATVGVAVDRHYMGDFLMDVAVFGHAEDCCPPGSRFADNHDDHGCHNEASHEALDQDYLGQQFKTNLATQWVALSFTPAPVTAYLAYPTLSPHTHTPAAAPDPPPPARNIPVWVQAFRC